MKVVVKWLKGPQKYGVAKSMGDNSVMDKKRAEELADDGVVQILNEIKQPKVHKAVIRDKDS